MTSASQQTPILIFNFLHGLPDTCARILFRTLASESLNIALIQGESDYSKWILEAVCENINPDYEGLAPLRPLLTISDVEFNELENKMMDYVAGECSQGDILSYVLKYRRQDISIEDIVETIDLFRIAISNQDSFYGEAQIKIDIDEEIEPHYITADNPFIVLGYETIFYKRVMDLPISKSQQYIFYRYFVKGELLYFVYEAIYAQCPLTIAAELLEYIRAYSAKTRGFSKLIQRTYDSYRSMKVPLETIDAPYTGDDASEEDVPCVTALGPIPQSPTNPSPISSDSYSKIYTSLAFHNKLSCGVSLFKKLFSGGENEIKTEIIWEGQQKDLAIFLHYCYGKNEINSDYLRRASKIFWWKRKSDGKIKPCRLNSLKVLPPQERDDKHHLLGSWKFYHDLFEGLGIERNY